MAKVEGIFNNSEVKVNDLLTISANMVNDTHLINIRDYILDYGAGNKSHIYTGGYKAPEAVIAKAGIIDTCVYLASEDAYTKPEYKAIGRIYKPPQFQDHTLIDPAICGFVLSLWETYKRETYNKSINKGSFYICCREGRSRSVALAGLILLHEAFISEHDVVHPATSKEATDKRTDMIFNLIKTEKVTSTLSGTVAAHYITTPSVLTWKSICDYHFSHIS